MASPRAPAESILASPSSRTWLSVFHRLCLCNCSRLKKLDRTKIESLSLHLFLFSLAETICPGSENCLGPPLADSSQQIERPLLVDAEGAWP
jgi:hypothetical protein